MATDPIQALIDAGAIPSSPFAVDSRYAGVPFGLYQNGPDDPGVAYVLRRFIPQERAIPAAFQHVVSAGERPDLIAFKAFGDAELFWRIADANVVTDPNELTDTLGERIAIPNPPGA